MKKIWLVLSISALGIQGIYISLKHFQIPKAIEYFLYKQLTSKFFKRTILIFSSKSANISTQEYIFNIWFIYQRQSGQICPLAYEDDYPGLFLTTFPRYSFDSIPPLGQKIATLVISFEPKIWTENRYIICRLNTTVSNFLQSG